MHLLRYWITPTLLFSLVQAVQAQVPCTALISYAFDISSINEAVLLPADDPLEFEVVEDLAKPEPVNPSRNDCVAPVRTDHTICQARLSTPSIWWFREQYGPKLILHWLGYPTTEQRLARIDVVLDQSRWNQIDRYGRYSFVNHFGEVARSYQSSARFFNRQGDCLAAYTCVYGQDAAKCQVLVSPIGL